MRRIIQVILILLALWFLFLLCGVAMTGLQMVLGQ